MAIQSMNDEGSEKLFVDALTEVEKLHRTKQANGEWIDSQSELSEDEILKLFYKKLGKTDERQARSVLHRLSLEGIVQVMTEGGIKLVKVPGPCPE